MTLGEFARGEWVWARIGVAALASLASAWSILALANDASDEVDGFVIGLAIASALSFIAYVLFIRTARGSVIVGVLVVAVTAGMHIAVWLSEGGTRGFGFINATLLGLLIVGLGRVYEDRRISRSSTRTSNQVGS